MKLSSVVCIGASVNGKTRPPQDGDVLAVLVLGCSNKQKNLMMAELKIIF